MTSRPLLTVVGTGICYGTDLGASARDAILEADEVFVLTSDAIGASLIQRLRPDAKSLSPLYSHEKERRDTYEAMVEAVLDGVRAGRTVCFAIPGHPGVFAQPTHEAVRRARAEGYTAVMLPALSAADHLYADLGVDPGQPGSVNFDATDFLVQGRTPDTTAALILWQIGAIGETRNPRAVNQAGLRLLTEVLLESYHASHEVVVYEAARNALCDPVVRRTPLASLADVDVPLLATLYVSPTTFAPPIPERLRRLRLVSLTA